jgi:hypothetical protein
MTIKAILIDSEPRTLSYVDVPAEIPPTPADYKPGDYLPGLQIDSGMVRSLLGCRSLQIVPVHHLDCALIVDERGLLTEPSPEHFFQFNFDDWYPVIGKALLLKHDVMTDAWSDVPVTIEQLNEVVEFSRRKVHGFKTEDIPGGLSVSVEAPKYDE